MKCREEGNVMMQERDLYDETTAVFTKGEEKRWMKVG